MSGSSNFHKSAKSSRLKGDEDEVLLPVYVRFRIVTDSHVYPLANRFTYYDEKVAKPVAKRPSGLQLPMKSEFLDDIDLITII